jgi:hypothetical protein
MQILKTKNNLLKGVKEVLAAFNIFQFALILFCSCILFQAYSFNGLTRTNLNDHQTLNIYTAKYHTDKCISAEIPLQSGHSSQYVDAEVEPTEDDIHCSLSESTTHPAQRFQLGEFIYTSFIKSRYLRLTSSVYEQEEVPYFVLYHSWKNFIG